MAEALSDLQKRQLRQRDGVIITEVLPKSAAANAGLKSGDVIVQLGQIGIENFEVYRSVLPKLPKDRPIAIRFIRQGQAVFRTIQLDAK